MIVDSGERRKFESGAVRDIQEGKGRCDLLPLQEISEYLDDEILTFITGFMKFGDVDYLKLAIGAFIGEKSWDKYTAILELSIHYEEGAKKYAERNWEKGIPLHCFIDSGVRHYLKFKRGDKDERHDRAFMWNMFGAIWTARKKPELCDLPCFQEAKNEEKNIHGSDT